MRKKIIVKISMVLFGLCWLLVMQWDLRLRSKNVEELAYIQHGDDVPENKLSILQITVSFQLYSTPHIHNFHIQTTIFFFTLFYQIREQKKSK